MICLVLQIQLKMRWLCVLTWFRLLQSGRCLFGNGAQTPQEVLDKIPDDDRETATVVVAPDEHGVKTLGVGWNMNDDTFVFLIPEALKEHPVLKSGAITMTRRKLLSAIATVFDPVGWLSPLTVRMKILFQKSWDTTSSWNDKLTAETCVQFHDWVMDLLQIEFLTIPRRVVLTGYQRQSQTMNCMCSRTHLSKRWRLASMWCAKNDGVKSSRLLCAKTKLAPRKLLSIPRLELGGMVLAARLIQACRRALLNHNYRCTSITCYTRIQLWRSIGLRAIPRNGVHSLPTELWLSKTHFRVIRGIMLPELTILLIWRRETTNQSSRNSTPGGMDLHFWSGKLISRYST